MRGIALTSIGVLAGTAIALPLNRLWEGLLFETSPTDPITLVMTALGLLTVAALASVPPARETVKIQPMDALRAD